MVEDLIGKVHKLTKRLFEVYPKMIFLAMLNCYGIGFNNGVRIYRTMGKEIGVKAYLFRLYATHCI